MGAHLHRMSKYRPSIFQGRLDLFRTAPSLSLTHEHPAERTLFRMLVAVLLVIAGVYIYFVGASVLNVIARKEALLQTAQLTGAVSSLEREYFLVAKSITPEAGERLGLAPVANTAYVRRPGVVGDARLREDVARFGEAEARLPDGSAPVTSNEI